STVFGLFLHVGEGLHFWPELVVQTGCAIWVMSLVLRAAGFAVGPWHRTLIVAGIALVTALPVLSSTLLTGRVAGLGALSLPLLSVHPSLFAPMNRIGLFLPIACATATASATLGVSPPSLILPVATPLSSPPPPLRALLPSGGAI